MVQKSIMIVWNGMVWFLKLYIFSAIMFIEYAYKYQKFGTKHKIIAHKIVTILVHKDGHHQQDHEII